MRKIVMKREHRFENKITLIKEDSKKYYGYYEKGKAMSWTKTEKNKKAVQENNWKWFENNEPDELKYFTHK